MVEKKSSKSVLATDIIKSIVMCPVAIVCHAAHNCFSIHPGPPQPRCRQDLCPSLLSQSRVTPPAQNQEK